MSETAVERPRVERIPVRGDISHICAAGATGRPSRMRCATIPSGEMMVGCARGFALVGMSSWPAGIWLVLGVASIVFGVWPDVGALLLAVFAIVTALGVHTFWKDADPQQRMTEMQNHVRNWTFVGAAIVLFAVFASLGDRVPYVLVPPLIRL